MSDYIKKLLGQAEGDFWSELPATPSRPVDGQETRSVRRDAFDKAAWDQITDQVPALQEQVAKAQEDHGTAGAGYEDLFNLLNQGDPRFHGAEAMRNEYLTQRAAMQSMLASEDFKWVRNETKYDEYSTALAMLSMERQMEEALSQVDEANELIEAAQEALDEAVAAAQAFMAEQGQPGGEGDQEGVGVSDTSDTEQAIIDRLEDALKGKAEAEAQGEAAADQAGETMESGAKAAKDAIEAEQEAAGGYGIEPGKLKKMSFEERRSLADKLHKSRMSRFARMLGQFRMAAGADRRRKVTGSPASKFDVELGSDITKLLSSEVERMVLGETEDDFWVRYAQGELMQWVTRGPERAGRGPILVVCDESGSMGAQLTDDGSTREAWSKAVSLALCDQAKFDKRDFIYIGFGSAGQQWEVKFDNGRYEPEEVMRFAEHFFCGGTQYEGPLTRAMEIIGTYKKSGKGKPDVVFITDGQCHVGETFVEKWAEVKDTADVRCYGIQIGGSGRYTALEQLVDRLIDVNQLNAGYDAVSELYRTI